MNMSVLSTKLCHFLFFFLCSKGFKKMNNIYRAFFVKKIPISVLTYICMTTYVFITINLCSNVKIINEHFKS